MSLKRWEKRVLQSPGADKRVREIEDELRLAAGLTALREKAGLSQRELAERIGISQPRVAAIERSRNVTIDVLEQYVEALGAHLEVSVVRGKRRTPLLATQRGSSARAATPGTRPAQPTPRRAPTAAVKRAAAKRRSV
jgi:transcriptional regulator with XRE-family HTH domain